MSWGLLTLVFVAVATIAGWAGWSLAGRTGLIVGLSLAVLLALLRAAPTLIAAIFRRSERRRAEQDG